MNWGHLLRAAARAEEGVAPHSESSPAASHMAVPAPGSRFPDAWSADCSVAGSSRPHGVPQSRQAHQGFAGLRWMRHLWVPAVCALIMVRVGNAADAPSGIASAHWLATEAGHRILAEGGNAFDAGVAMAAVLAVVEPESSGLGGGGFFLLHVAKDGKNVFVDARERAPAAATRDMYLDAAGQPRRELSVNGALAAAIPGQPAGLVHLSRSYGRLPLAQLLKPAISLARDGFPWSAKNATMIGFRADALAKSPAAAAQFLKAGKPPKQGDRIRLPDLARTLEAIAERGHRGFYAGKLARRMVEGVRAAGGIWTLADLADYAVVERQALSGQYGDWQIITAPPPSSGGVALLQMFNQLSGYPLPSFDRVQRLHVLTEVMRRAYRDRAIYLGDPDFAEIPVDMLVHPFYAAGLRASIRLDQATPSSALPGIAAGPAGTDTTHFSVIDGEGNRLAATLSVNLPFGAAFVAPGTGFVLNNEMDDFSVKPGVPNAYGLVGDDANAIAPGKRPLSSMTPTFALHKDGTAVVIGTPGGSRIISMVLFGLLELIEGRDASAAVALPRLHHQYLPDVLSAEPEALSEAEIAALSQRGFTVSPGERPWGNMHVVVRHADGRIQAASDPRWPTVGRATVQ